MKTSGKGIEFIKGFESLHLKAYMCPAGRFTIGWGHTGGVREGQSISVAEAEKLLADDIAVAEACVSKAGVFRQSQFDALVSFVFNVGIVAFTNSTLRRLVVSDSNNPKIRDEFKRWKYATVGNEKVELEGLLRRRVKEADLYFKTE